MQGWSLVTAGRQTILAHIPACSIWRQLLHHPCTCTRFRSSGCEVSEGCRVVSHNKLNTLIPKQADSSSTTRHIPNSPGKQQSTKPAFVLNQTRRPQKTHHIFQARRSVSVVQLGVSASSAAAARRRGRASFVFRCECACSEPRKTHRIAVVQLQHLTRARPAACPQAQKACCGGCPASTGALPATTPAATESAWTFYLMAVAR